MYIKAVINKNLKKKNTNTIIKFNN